MNDILQPVAHFVAFTALLRRADFAVAPEQTMAWLASIELLGPNSIEDIRRAGYATLAPQPERRADFDALFAAHFLGARSIVPEAAPGEDEPIRAAEDATVGPEPLFGDETRESGAQATTAERLSARRFDGLLLNRRILRRLVLSILSVGELDQGRVPDNPHLHAVGLTPKQN